MASERWQAFSAMGCEVMQAGITDATNCALRWLPLSSLRHRPASRRAMTVWPRRLPLANQLEKLKKAPSLKGKSVNSEVAKARGETDAK